jgi:hypothetical protein
VDRICIHGLVFSRKRDWKRRLFFYRDRFLETRQHILRQPHFRQ